MPGGFTWPDYHSIPCWFLAQVSLSDLQWLDTGFALPSDGLLSFFYHDDRGPPGPGSKVFYFPPAGLRRADVVADPRYGVGFHDRHLYPRALTLSQGYCLPDDMQALDLTPQERAVWKDPSDPRGPNVLGRVREDHEDFGHFREVFHNRFAPTTHRLFGLPPFERPPRGHRLVTSFGQMEDRLNFYVPEADVATLEFGNLKVTYEST